jgi:hypothetical protein
MVTAHRRHHTFKETQAAERSSATATATSLTDFLQIGCDVVSCHEVCCCVAQCCVGSHPSSLDVTSCAVSRYVAAAEEQTLDVCVYVCVCGCVNIWQCERECACICACV